MKKVVLIIVAVILVAASGLLIAENRYSKDRIEFVGETESVEYSLKQLKFYNSIKDEFDASADLLDKNTKIVAVDEYTAIQFKLPNKPIRVYELDASDDKNEKLKVSYNKQDKVYSLSPLYDSEVCSYDVVADYGITKNVYSFCVYNKTYIEKNYNKVSVDELSKSPYDEAEGSENVSVTIAENAYQIDTITFSFTIKNSEAKPIDCSFMKLEKQIDGEWYSVEENDVTGNKEFWDNFKKKASPTINSNQSETIDYTAGLGALFNCYTGNYLSSGVYRVVIPYTCDNKTEFAVSEPFTIGYVPLT